MPIPLLDSERQRSLVQRTVNIPNLTLGVDLRGAVALPNLEKLVSLSACDLCSPEADSLLTAPYRPCQMVDQGKESNS